MAAPPDLEEQFARWLAAYPAATLLEIAAFFAARPARPLPRRDPRTVATPPPHATAHRPGV